MAVRSGSSGRSASVRSDLYSLAKREPAAEDRVVQALVPDLVDRQRDLRGAAHRSPRRTYPEARPGPPRPSWANRRAGRSRRPLPVGRHGGAGRVRRPMLRPRSRRWAPGSRTAGTAPGGSPSDPWPDFGQRPLAHDTEDGSHHRLPSFAADLLGRGTKEFSPPRCPNRRQMGAKVDNKVVKRSLFTRGS